MDELSITEYLGKKGITITGQYFRSDKVVDKNDIIYQINLMVELHKTLKGTNFNELSRIRSTIGREVEGYKVQMKKLEKNYAYLFTNTCTNEIENLILSNGRIMLNKASKAISHIHEHDYFGVIKRSMNREEICLGKVDRNNLRKNDKRIEIGTIKSMAYNLVEEDLYSYIKKLQKKEFDIDEEELIKTFVYGSHLSFNSIDYLRGLLSYPREFLKIWERYMESKKEHINKNYHTLNVSRGEGKKGKSETEILLELNKSLKYESKNFIK